MKDSGPFIFYDIASPIEPRSYAPNPSKGRLALSFKGVPFETTFVEITDISKVRKGLDCPATRTFDDGSDYYTLPMLQAPSGEVIGDSFDIANYLEDTFPDSGSRLFPQNSTRTGLDYESPQKDTTIMIPITTNKGKNNQDYARFNWHVDVTFTQHVLLVAYYMPFNPATEEATRECFLKRAKMDSWEQFKVEGEMREGIKASFKESLTSLAKLFTVNEDGPFLEGNEANYADLIVGGWLNMFSECMPSEEWKDFRTWHGGVFARLHDALHENYYVCK
ncbi:uncharacterized protein M421DRAFT_420494 [Didymella exigua CBS 183.55]|uniref:GST N-terminal domain-containing protein n=1 Tax=Didymella exigua CBS 183.55 TaxID=1150837 RepID=A0A6A5RMU8_9PLEO|nr:uncharacterized protein M421DRAFT_420494 [Didymella exigua CBS 183.55]KAF1928610.1 hypothetical protein M421DRAFT_420494 [Didymella exigua CBS 183.55]